MGSVEGPFDYLYVHTDTAVFAESRFSIMIAQCPGVREAALQDIERAR
jgi:hypothetical protein